MVNKADNPFSKVLKDFDPLDSSTSTVLKGVLNTYPFLLTATHFFLKTINLTLIIF